MSIPALFTQETVECITKAIPQMRIGDQRQIKVSLCSSEACLSDEFLTRMIHFFPQCHVHTINTSAEKRCSLLGPLLVWGLSQTWAEKCDVKNILSTWSKLLKRFPAIQGMTPGDIGLSLLPLLDNASLQLKEQSKNNVYAELYRTMSPLLSWHRAELENVAMLRLAELSYRSIGSTIGGVTLGDHWQKHMANLVTSANYYDQARLLENVIKSSLPQSYKMSTLNAANPLLWLDPRFVPSIKILLGAKENIGSLVLPWVSASSITNGIHATKNHDIHRQLYQEYCPNLYMTLSLVATNDSDWQNKACIWKYVDALGMHRCTEEFQLPDDIVFKADAISP